MELSHPTKYIAVGCYLYLFTAPNLVAYQLEIEQLQDEIDDFNAFTRIIVAA